MIASNPKPGGTATVSHTSQIVQYNLHRGDSDTSPLVGSDIISFNGPSSTFCAEENGNLFRHYYVKEFKHEDRVYIRPILPFEFVQRFGLADDSTYKLSQH